MFKSRKIRLLVTLGLFSFTTQLSAAVTYIYTGNDYITFPPTGDNDFNGHSITGWFTVDNPLDPNISEGTLIKTLVTDFSFSNGLFEFTPVNTPQPDPNVPFFNPDFYVGTDSEGNITSWSIFGYETDLSDGIYHSFGTRNDSSGVFDVGTVCPSSSAYGCIPILYQGWVADNPGSWSVVPIPAAFWLFGSGLLGLVGIARRKKAA